MPPRTRASVSDCGDEPAKSPLCLACGCNVLQAHAHCPFESGDSADSVARTPKACAHSRLPRTRASVLDCGDESAKSPLWVAHGGSLRRSSPRSLALRKRRLRRLRRRTPNASRQILASSYFYFQLNLKTADGSAFTCVDLRFNFSARGASADETSRRLVEQAHILLAIQHGGQNLTAG